MSLLISKIRYSIGFNWLLQHYLYIIISFARGSSKFSRRKNLRTLAPLAIRNSLWVYLSVFFLSFEFCLSLCFALCKFNPITSIDFSICVCCVLKWVGNKTKTKPGSISLLKCACDRVWVIVCVCVCVTQQTLTLNRGAWFSGGSCNAHFDAGKIV